MAMECVCVPAIGASDNVCMVNDACNNVCMVNDTRNNVCNDMQICIPICEENITISEPRKPICRPKLPKPSIDLCKILERSKDETHKHDDFGCHYQGEKRQNLINKLKMYLDCCDDRPVIKVTGGSGGAGHCEVGSTICRTGFGPIIKYPGYVDYNHPYFRCPYNKFPCLASTVTFTGGVNPCSPYPLCPDSEFLTCEGTGGAVTGAGTTCTTTVTGGSSNGTGGHLCHCAKRRGEEPFCTASGKTRTDCYTNTSTRYETTTCNPCATQTQTQVTCVPPGGSGRYCCIPLPDNC